MRHILFQLPIPWLVGPWLAAVATIAIGLILGGLGGYQITQRSQRKIDYAVAALLVPLGILVMFLVAIFLFRAQFTWKHVPIMGYGLMIVLGFVSGIGLAVWRAKRCGENPEHVMNIGLLSLLGGIGGARLLYVLGNLDEFTGRGLLGNLFAMVNVRAGGLVYYGGLLAATAFAIIYIIAKKLSYRRMLDIIAPSLMLGLAFGRAGCFLNGCCWGGKCTLFHEAEVRRAQLAAAGQPVPEPSGFERLMKASLVEFPYGSPAYEQHARELPWRVVNSDGQPSGYIIRENFDRDLWLRVPDDGDPGGASVDVPVRLLRPTESTSELGQPHGTDPKNLKYMNWEVVDGAGHVIGYLSPAAVNSHIVELRGPDGRVYEYREKPGPLPYAASRPDGPVLRVERSAIVNTSQGLQVNVRHVGREELEELGLEFKYAAAAVHSLPIYPVQLYGIFNALLLTIVLSVFFARRWREGQVFALMLILYPITRFLLEGIRKDTAPVSLGMTLSQNISLYMFIGGVLMWLSLYYLPAVARVPLTGNKVQDQTRQP